VITQGVENKWNNGAMGNVCLYFGQVCAGRERACYNVGVVFSDRKVFLSVEVTTHKRGERVSRRRKGRRHKYRRHVGGGCDSGIVRVSQSRRARGGLVAG
jgi:hypothetical protein